LQRIVTIELNRVGSLLSDRKRHAYDGRTVAHIDNQLKDIRNKLADVLPHRVTTLEPQRLLITQNISVTESEKATTKDHSPVELDDDIPW
jgi:hypothetical protein